MPADHALAHGLPDRLGRLEDGLRSTGRPELATLVLAVLRGLLLDLDATGDTARADRAFADFLALAERPTGDDGRTAERTRSG